MRQLGAPVTEIATKCGVSRARARDSLIKRDSKVRAYFNATVDHCFAIREMTQGNRLPIGWIATLDAVVEGLSPAQILRSKVARLNEVADVIVMEREVETLRQLMINAIQQSAQP